MPPSAYASPPVQAERTVATPSLRSWRYRIAFDQAELAAAVGVSPSTIARLEHGGRTRPEVVERLTALIAREYDCPIDQVDLTRPVGHA